MEGTTRDLNCCLVNRYTNANIAGRLHADDEDIISTTSSIVTVSLGAVRTIDFTATVSPVLLRL